MRNVLIVITNPAVSPVMTGTKRRRRVRFNAIALINTLAPEQTKAQAEQLVMESISHAHANHLTLGKMENVPAIVLINFLAMEQMKRAVVDIHAMENMIIAVVRMGIHGMEVFVEFVRILTNLPAEENMK